MSEERRVRIQQGDIVDPRGLHFTQSNECCFPRIGNTPYDLTKDKYGITVAVDSSGEIYILDGHNRACMALAWGNTIRIGKVLFAEIGDLDECSQ